MKYLRIVFCILACLCVAATVPVGVLTRWEFALIPVAGAILFACLMFGAKNGFRKTPPAARTDFMNTKEENEKIMQEKHDEE